MKTEFLRETLDRRKVKKNNKITSTTSLILALNGVSGLTMATIAVNYGFKMVFAKIDAHILLTDPLNMFIAITTRTDGTKHLYKPTDGASYKDGHDLDNLGKSLGIK